MEKLEAKLATMEKALLTLEEVVHSWDKAIGQREEKMLRLDPFAEEDRLLTYLRDSLVKRF